MRKCLSGSGLARSLHRRQLYVGVIPRLAPQHRLFTSCSPRFQHQPENLPPRRQQELKHAFPNALKPLPEHDNSGNELSFHKIYDATPRPRTHKLNKRLVSVALGIGILLVGAYFLGPEDLYEGLNSSRDKTPLQQIFAPPLFTPFTITKREEISPTSIILTVRPRLVPRDFEDPYKLCWEAGTWSVEVKQPQLMIAREYTPLPPKLQDNNGELRFLIRKEHKGEVSGYLHNLHVGDTIELRGPKSGIQLPDEVTNVVFLAGGTGIAPALQVVHTLLERKSVRTPPKIHIIWANRRREDCQGGLSFQREEAFWDKYIKTFIQFSGLSLEWHRRDQSDGQEDEQKSQGDSVGHIVQELQSMQITHPHQLRVDYLVDEEGILVDGKRLSRALELKDDVDKRGTNFLFVSGPKGFVKYLAGPSALDSEVASQANQVDQAKLSGLLGCTGIRGWECWTMP